MINKIKKVYLQHKEIINYLVFGTLTTIVTLSVYYIITHTILNPKKAIELQIANVISWTCGFLFAYITNRKFVFESKKDKKKEFILFFLSRISTLLLDMVIMFIFVTLLKLNDSVFKLVSQVMVIVSNYILSKIVVFKK